MRQLFNIIFDHLINGRILCKFKITSPFLFFSCSLGVSDGDSMRTQHFWQGADCAHETKTGNYIFLSRLLTSVDMQLHTCH